MKNEDVEDNSGTNECADRRDGAFQGELCSAAYGQYV